MCAWPVGRFVKLGSDGSKWQIVGVWRQQRLADGGAIPDQRAPHISRCLDQTVSLTARGRVVGARLRGANQARVLGVQRADHNRECPVEQGQRGELGSSGERLGCERAEACSRFQERSAGPTRRRLANTPCATVV
jgi:hypothetical protein